VWWILWGQRLLWHRVGLKPPKVNDHTELKKEKTILITRLHVLQWKLCTNNKKAWHSVTGQCWTVSSAWKPQLDNRDFSFGMMSLSLSYLGQPPDWDRECSVSTTDLSPHDLPCMLVPLFSFHGCNLCTSSICPWSIFPILWGFENVQP